MKIDHQNLKECFSLFATGVMIATTNIEGKNYGLTINSFSSVSLDPALCLFSIGKDSFNLEYFRRSTSFALNILSASQTSLAKDFASQDYVKKWQNSSFELSQNNNPIFSGINGYIECSNHQIIEAGDHYIFLGKIVDCAKLSDEDGLIYYKHQFC